MANPALEPAFLDAALGVARNAASAAAQVIRRYYRGQFETRSKDDASPVTQADVDSESVIRAVLLAAYPDHAIYGEEAGAPAGDYLWLVDPIDGTKSFVRGYPMFSTQIALMHRGELVLGVSCASAYRETAWARRGGGAWLNGVPLQGRGHTDWSKAALSTGNLKTLARGPRLECPGRTGTAGPPRSAATATSALPPARARAHRLRCSRATSTSSISPPSR
jgi:histidinol-phosphatase